ncbi:MAG: 50S ribosomal protein L11 methyltransferase, partial [Deltaproteobacteria bacterium]|nr:50S ribosomal protein L11 methyltransferase [Deltaproteobacteria bacterium]
MFEIEIKLDLNLVTSLLNRLVNSFPEFEIETIESGLRFYLDPGDDIDARLKNLDQILSKFEKARMGEDQVSLALQNIGEPDRIPPRISVGRFIISRNEERIEDLPGKTIIPLSPHNCFGTGAHPSTALVLIAMEEFYTSKPGYPDPMNSSVLDAGTGSGILALAAANLGTGSILAVDSSSAAIDT